MRERADDILDGAELWERYAASLIIDFGIAPNDAWSMSIGEYWMLHGYKYNGNKKQVGKTISREQGLAMFVEMREKGLIK